jgi:hypothetical protein
MEDEKCTEYQYDRGHTEERPPWGWFSSVVSEDRDQSTGSSITADSRQIGDSPGGAVIYQSRGLVRALCHSVSHMFRVRVRVVNKRRSGPRRCTILTGPCVRLALQRIGIVLSFPPRGYESWYSMQMRLPTASLDLITFQAHAHSIPNIVLDNTILKRI